MDQQSDRGYIYGEQIDMPVLAPNDPCSCVVCHDIYDAEEDRILGRIHEVDGETVCSDCRTGYAKKVLSKSMKAIKLTIDELSEELFTAARKLGIDACVVSLAKFDDLSLSLENEAKQFGDDDGKR